MTSPLSCLLLLLAIHQGSAQLAAVFSSVNQTTTCATWSEWGNCVWLRGVGKGGSQPYLQQLSPECREHWFYKTTRRRFGTALNNFFQYLKDITDEEKPCGMCSYRQSCGAGGPKQCDKIPWVVGRPVAPFHVAEQVCIYSDLGGHQQNKPCKVKYQAVKKNGGECQVWPSAIPELPGIEPSILELLYRLKWSNCVRDDLSKPSRNSDPKYCRCCCFPFEPKLVRGKWRCQHVGCERSPAPVPGLERLNGVQKQCPAPSG